ncbi:hypothetical protein [Streptomyces candidus]|uniref:Uncharacterized protein n=1 Tax=Streptomyces candidus TaxID=67283 RepID=A0A7X0LSZ3_9ACTN|nr:hypothetical protein [Streptomyces candidus]MBB6440248.1 hypothetical protein [Streptomyces candidus]GHH57756.1 hypothetical protein GCM10018773_65580 [Streptomyces candidus]
MTTTPTGVESSAAVTRTIEEPEIDKRSAAGPYFGRFSCDVCGDDFALHRSLTVEEREFTSIETGYTWPGLLVIACDRS